MQIVPSPGIGILLCKKRYLFRIAYIARFKWAYLPNENITPPKILNPYTEY
jgi:hypothetical protein